MDAVTVAIEQDTISQAFARLGDAAASVFDAIARTTAERLRGEMQSRLRRQTAGTGQTADAITVSKDGAAYLVTSIAPGSRAANLPIWLEFGTKHAAARPYFYAAVALEHGTYLRDVERGLQSAIDGLGGA